MKYQIKSFYYNSNIYFVFSFIQIAFSILLVYFFLNDLQNFHDQKLIVLEVALGVCMILDLSLWSSLEEQKFTILYSLEWFLVFLFLIFLTNVMIEKFVDFSKKIEIFFMGIRIFIQILRLFLQFQRMKRVQKVKSNCQLQLQISDNPIDLECDLDSSINSDKNEIWSS